MVVNQVKTLENKKITTIELGYMSRENGEKLAKKLNGKTYMNFEIIVAPTGGQYYVTAQTNYDDKKDTILGMFLYTMACEIV